MSVEHQNNASKFADRKLHNENKLRTFMWIAVVVGLIGILVNPQIENIDTRAVGVGLELISILASKLTRTPLIK